MKIILLLLIYLSWGQSHELAEKLRNEYIDAREEYRAYKRDLESILPNVLSSVSNLKKYPPSEEELIFWNSSLKKYSELMNRQIQLKEEYLANVVATDVENLYKKKKNPGRKITELVKSVRKNFKVYDENKNKFGVAEQRYRLYSLTDLFEETREYAQAKGLPVPKNKSVVGVDDFLFNMGLMKITSNIMLPFFSRPGLLKTPLTRKFNQFFHEVKNRNSLKVEVEGKELIAPFANNSDGIINFFLPSHKSGVADAILMAEFDLPHYLLFANPMAFLSLPSLAKKLADVPEFIAVGKVRGSDGMKPADKLSLMLEKGLSTNVWNYPQGFVPFTGEINPVRQGFGEAVIKKALDDGYKVRIIPISYEVNSQFWSDSEIEGKTIKAKVSTILEPELVENIVRMVSPEFLENLLRFLWDEEIKEHKELDLEELERRIRTGGFCQFNL